jgi:hypothetical protein
LTRLKAATLVAPELGAKLLRRFHDAEDRVVGDEQPDGPLRTHGRDLGPKTRIAGVTLAAATPELGRQLGGMLEIGSTPFLVGRAPLNGEPTADLSVDVELWDHGPLRLSRDHFAIIQRDGRLFVRDLRSTLGTTVNGRPIGEHFGSDEAPLHEGDNEIGHNWATNAASVHQRCKAILGRTMDRRDRCLGSPEMQRKNQVCVDRALKRALAPAVARPAREP